MVKSQIIFIHLLLIIFFTSCKKDWIEIKPNKSLVIIETLDDLQALLDNMGVMNTNIPSLGHIGADNYFFPENYLPYIQKIASNAYMWIPDVYDGASVSDWNLPYNRVYFSNLALEGLNDILITSGNQNKWNNVKGSALFYRAFSFLNLLELFAKPFDSLTSVTDLGVPLKLTSDINEKVGRSTVQQSYERVIDDLKQSAGLLPVIQEKNVYMRPTKHAAYALLARVLLYMGNYEVAKLYADSCLDINDDLIDFSNVDTNKTYSSIKFPNQEVIFYATLIDYGNFFAEVDTILFNQYDQNDLRRSVFFNNNGNSILFKGSYTGYYTPLFGGLSTNETYLIRAECNARLGYTSAAMDDLNNLLITRWRPGEFSSYTASDPEEALQLILSERNKELPFRPTRWADLRRLNKDSRFAVSISRKVNGQLIVLPPNDNKYVYPIPDNEILYNNIPQNPR